MLGMFHRCTTRFCLCRKPSHVRTKKHRPGSSSRARMRDPIAQALCPDCKREAQNSAGGNVVKILVTVPYVPSEFSATHNICASCLELRRHDSRHAERCELGLANMALQSAGWATALSEFLRQDLRARRPKW